MIMRKLLPAFVIIFISLSIFNSPCSGISDSLSLKVGYTKNLFTINNKEIFFYSGEIHYFRCPHELWQDRLEKIKSAGCNSISTYVPWNYHEPGENRLDLKELDDFLTLCEKMGFYVIIKPGPYIDSEWDAGAIPSWLIAKGVRLRSNDPDFMNYAQKWYRSVLRVIRDHLVTRGGCIYLVQIESKYSNSAQYKKEALRNLYRITQEMGINVPIITSGSLDARDNNDPDMANIIDSPNLNVLWDLDYAKKMIRSGQIMEPVAPTMSTKIETGKWTDWYDELPESNPDIQTDKLNALTKTGIQSGWGLFNYYMFYGGTNFGYNKGCQAATTNDWFVPLREWGGLSQKYYTAKLIGDWLRLFGTSVAKSEFLINGAQVINPALPPLYQPLVEWKHLLLKTVDWWGAELQQNYDASLWKTVSIGNNFEHCLIDYNGYAYYRTYMQVDSNLLNYPELYLNFWGAGDNVFVFVNGKLAGKHYQGDEKFSLTIKNWLSAGNNCIVVAAEIIKSNQINQIVPKGIYKSVILSSLPVEEPLIRISEKVYKNQAFIFLYNNSSQIQSFKFTLTDPETNSRYTVPSKFLMTLTKQDMQILLCNVPIGNSLLKYCTSQILGITHQKEENQLIVYGDNGLPGEAAFKLPVKPQIMDTNTISWSEENKILTVFYKHSSKPQYIQIGLIKLIILDTFQAQRTWILHGLKDYSYPFISESHFLRSAEVDENHLSAILENKPGTAHVSITGLPEPGQVRLDGRKIPFSYNKNTHITEFSISVPDFSFKEISFNRAKFHKEDFDDLTRAREIILQPLEALGDYEKGYKVYQTTFEYVPADSIVIESWILDENRMYPQRYPHKSIPPPEKQYADPKMVLLNGRYVSSASNENAVSSANISNYLRQGTNILVIVLESLVRDTYEETGGKFERLKGPVRVHLKNGNRIIKDLVEWNYKNSLDGQGTGYYRTTFSDFVWKTISFGNWKLNDKKSNDYNGIMWYRLNFDLDLPEDWSLPLRLSLQAKTQTLIYLNGKLLGRYKDTAPQQDFYLPDSWLNRNDENNITFAVQNSGEEGGLYEAVIKPYQDDCVQPQRLEIRF